MCNIDIISEGYALQFSNSYHLSTMNLTSSSREDEIVVKTDSSGATST